MVQALGLPQGLTMALQLSVGQKWRCQKRQQLLFSRLQNLWQILPSIRFALSILKSVHYSSRQ